jgi:two-component system, CitB family, sensor kinase
VFIAFTNESRKPMRLTVGHPRHWSLATQLLVLQLSVVVLLLGASLVAAYLESVDASEDRAAEVSLSVASTVAEMPEVVAALDDPEPSAVLQPLAERVRTRTDTDFVVVMTPTGTRFSHPEPDRIGKSFVGTIAPAAAGDTVVETYTGTLGRSVRAVVPVRSEGRVVGLVSVGITTDRVGQVLLATRVPWMVGFGLAVLLAGTLGTWLVTRRLRRQTRGLAPDELRSMYDYHDAVLHSVHEGLLVVDADGRLHLMNDEAARLLDLPPSAVGRTVEELEVPAHLAATLASGEARENELHVVASRIVVLNQQRTRWQGRDLGTVTTLRDRTELESLTGELDRARSLAEALRSQQHESMNRLHTVVSLIELGHLDKALAFAVEELQLAQQLTDTVVTSVGDPALAALLLGKAAEASELGVTFQVESDADLEPGTFAPRDLVTIVGNLVDNAFDATRNREPDPDRPMTVGVHVSERGDRVRIEVDDTGDGPPEDPVTMFDRGWTTKGTDRAAGRGLGLALVQQTVHRLGGTIEVIDDDGCTVVVELPVAAAHVRKERTDVAGPGR